VTAESPARSNVTRKLAIGAGLAAPVLLLGVLWLVVTNVLLVPPVPEPATSARDVLRFIVHEKGLPRLDDATARRVFHEQLGRLGRNDEFRERFLRELRIASPTEQRAFRSHLFDVFKPIFIADMRQYHELIGEERQAFLDDRIVYYNRLSAALGKTELSADAAAELTPDRQEMLQLVLSRTTEEERQMTGAYFSAIGARVEEILADPPLKAEFERRIAADEL
jgi:hypothetical protein